MLTMGRLLLAVSVMAACAGKPYDRPDTDAGGPPVCGNGIVEGTEICDDGNTQDGDDCSDNCSVGITQEACGNGTVDDGESCDDGNQVAGDGCSGDCTSTERCGNGVVDAATGETCDDGNTASGDGCSASCQSNEGCGNFTVDAGEQCDAGPNGSSTCDVNCTTATCGDGTVNAFRGEQCDAGPNGDASCDTNCTPAFCGDSTVNAARGETCDDGNNVTTDACIACVAATCGDGFVRAGVEQCDDANATNTDACVACKTARCGDGFVRAGVEQCDDGNAINGDGCSSTCVVEVPQPRVYVLSNSTCNTLVSAENQFACTSTQLSGFTRDCGGDADRTNPYDNCSGQPTGFTWMDSTPFQPSAVRIEVNVGINSAPNGTPINQTAVTSLNGLSSGNFLLAATAGQGQCNPVEVINTWNLTNVSTYRRNQQNTLSIAGMTGGCFGLGFTPAFNGYVRITVFP
jgi:cysteine-rich repeat protein